MANRAVITPELCRQLLRYEPETGKLYWLERQSDQFTTGGGKSAQHKCNAWNSRHAGREALTALVNGYRYGSIHNLPVRAHRVAWAIVHGSWPEIIDHINGDPLDNRLANLRNVSAAGNNLNMKRQNRNRTGATGVRPAGKGRWAAYHGLGRKYHHLGTFSTFAEAVAARREAGALLGFSARHGTSQ